MQKLLAVFVLGLIAASPSQAQNFSKVELERQLYFIMKWWPCEYDNHEQIVRRSGGGFSQPVYSPVSRVHFHYVRLDLPELGENVLYVEEYLNDNPANISLARVYALSFDEAENAIKVKTHVFKVGEQNMAGAWMGRDRLAAISVSELEPASNYEILLRFEGRQFNDGLKPESCGEEEWSEYQVIVGETYNWTRNRLVNRQTGKITGMPIEEANYEWIQGTRAHRFVCAVFDNLEGDMTQPTHLTKIEVHDQGGSADIPRPDGRTLEFQLHTREFASPSERVYPLFRIHEKGNQLPIAYGYTVDDADRFGIKLGWFDTRCNAKEQGAPL